jgi:Helix-turn-helix.
MKKIKIGYFLHKERLNLNLTQEAFVSNTLSVSQYSRIENGEQDIKSGDLFQILSNNKININDFFIKIFENQHEKISEHELNKIS